MAASEANQIDWWRENPWVAGERMLTRVVLAVLLGLVLVAFVWIVHDLAGTLGAWNAGAPVEARYEGARRVAVPGLGAGQPLANWIPPGADVGATVEVVTGTDGRVRLWAPWALRLSGVGAVALGFLALALLRGLRAPRRWAGFVGGLLSTALFFGVGFALMLAYHSAWEPWFAARGWRPWMATVAWIPVVCAFLGTMMLLGFGAQSYRRAAILRQGKVRAALVLSCEQTDDDGKIFTAQVRVEEWGPEPAKLWGLTAPIPEGTRLWLAVSDYYGAVALPAGAGTWQDGVLSGR